MPIPPPPPRNRVFCPVEPATAGDQTVRNAVSSAILHLPGVFAPLLTGDSGGLGALAQTATLYIIAHGDATRPRFSIGGQHWSAKELANILETAGLKKDHRQLVMLVCYAGSTLGTEAEMAGYARQRAGYAAMVKQFETSSPAQQATRHAPLEAAKKSLLGALHDAVPKSWDKVNAGAPARGAPKKPARGAAYLLPLVAQLVDELKRRSYSQIRVRAFTGEVDTNFKNGITVKTETRNEETQLVTALTLPAGSTNTVNWL